MTGLRALRRFAKSAPPAGCDLCGRELDDAHAHGFDRESRRLSCVCRPCSLLFAGSDGRYRIVEPTVERLDAEVDDACWRRLAIPVGLALILRESTPARTIALYPGPAGIVEAELNQDAVAGIDLLDSIDSDVQGLLVDRTPGHSDCYRVSLDVCFALVGELRSRRVSRDAAHAHMLGFLRDFSGRGASMFEAVAR